jgi:hypothetical protein
LSELLPAEVEGLRVLGRTPSVRAPPIVVPKALFEQHPAVVTALQAALSHVLGGGSGDDGALTDALAVLGLGGFVVAGYAEYDSCFAPVMQDLHGPGLTAVSARPGLQRRAEAWRAAVAVDDFWAMVDVGEYFFRPDAPVAMSADVARWFSRGLLQCFGFNHYAGVDCFEAALALEVLQNKTNQTTTPADITHPHLNPILATPD